MWQSSSKTVTQFNNQTKDPDYYQLRPSAVHTMVLTGAAKYRSPESFSWGINFGTLGLTPPSDWSSLTGWVTDPYGGYGPAPGINLAFRNAIASFRPDTLIYPKGVMANYWDWVSNNFVAENEFTTPYLSPFTGTNSILPDEYNINSVDYREVLPAAHIDNWRAFILSLASVGGIGPETFINGNLYLESSVNTTNLNLPSSNVKDQALTYRNPPYTLDVTFIEMGHEYYTAGGNTPDTPTTGGGHALRFPNGSDYANAYLTYLSDIRSDISLSSVYCAANLATPTTGSSSQALRRNAWNSSFLSTYLNNPLYLSDPSLYKIDAISIHSFYQIPVPSSPAVSAYNNFESWILSAANTQYSKVRTTIDDIKTLINTSNTSITHFMPKFWAVGYNIDDAELTSNAANAISGCWGHGLFNLQYQFLLMGDPDISMTAFHATHGGRQYSLIYSVTNAFGGGTTDLYDPSATGYVFQVFADAYKNSMKFQPIIVQGASSSLVQNLGIYGMAFLFDPIWLPGPPAPGTIAKSFIFMNVSGITRTLDLSQLIDPTDIIQFSRSIKAPLRAQINRITASGKITPTDTTVNSPATSSLLSYNLEPYEILYVAIEAI